MITCPPLDAPINGGYIEDSLDARPEVMMFCNGVYDIPEWEGFYGSLQCYDSLEWRPFSKLPDCIGEYVYNSLTVLLEVHSTLALVVIMLEALMPPAIKI